MRNPPYFVVIYLPNSMLTLSLDMLNDSLSRSYIKLAQRKPHANMQGAQKHFKSLI